MKNKPVPCNWIICKANGTSETIKSMQETLTRGDHCLYRDNESVNQYASCGSNTYITNKLNLHVW